MFIFILSFRLTAEIYPSTFLLLYMYANAPGYQYTCSDYFFLFGIICSITFPLSCWDMSTQIHPKDRSTCLSPLHKNKNLPVTTTTCVPALKCTRSWPYLFIFILLFAWLTAKIYLSTFLQLYMSTDISVHQYTCLVYFFLFGITCTVTFPLIC